MWRLSNISFNNLMAHSNTIIDPVQGVATMVQGVNNCNKGQESNGAGKTAILEAISISLIDQSMRGLSSKELVKDGTDELEILSLWDNNTTGEEMAIHRKIKRKGSSKIQVELNGEQVELPDVKTANEYILNKIQLSKGDVINYFLISKDKGEGFFDLSDTKKKEVISRFSQANLIDHIPVDLKASIGELTSKITSIDLDIANAKGKTEYIESEIEGMSEETEKSEWLQSYQTQLTSIQDKIKESLARVKTISEEKGLLYDQLSPLTEVNVDQEREKLRKVRSKATEVETDLRKYNSGKSKIEAMLKDMIECPKCSHKFKLGSEWTVDQLKDKYRQAVAKIEEVTPNIKKLKDFESKMVQDMNAANVVNETVQKLTARIKSIQLQFQTEESSLGHLRDKAIDLKKSMESYDGSTFKVKVDKLNDQLGGYYVQVANKEHDKLEVEKAIADKNKWTSIFSQFKNHLSNKTIKTIEIEVNSYLDAMGSDISVVIEGYKVNKDKSVKENITPTIYKDGSEFGSIKKLSAGERVRVRVAGILALQSLINTSCESGGLDFMFMDEIIESADRLGIWNIVSSLNKLNQTIFVTTHGSFDEVYPNTIIVTKGEDGTATV